MKNAFLMAILPAIIGISTQVHGQDSLQTQPKNAIYANAGTLGIWFSASANYERQLFTRDNRFYVNYYMRASAGAFASWGGNGPYGSLSLQGIFGEKKSHLEIGLGLAVFYDKSSYEIGVSNANFPYPDFQPEPSKWNFTSLTPAASVGYRYQKATGGFVFRTGIGFPDGIYVAIGMVF